MELNTNSQSESEEKFNKFPCEFSCSSCQNSLFYLKNKHKFDCRYSQCPDLCLMISSRFYSGLNPHINFFIKNQISTCDTCFRLDLCHISQCNFQKNLLHNTINEALEHTKSIHYLNENNVIFSQINKSSSDYIFNINLILSNLKNMNMVLEKYIFLWNKSKKIRQIYMKIYYLLNKKNFEKFKDGIDIDSTSEFQNIVIQLNNKFKEMIIKYSNKIEKKKISFMSNNIYDSENIFKAEQNINEYINLNYELMTITSEIYNISENIKNEIMKNVNMSTVIKSEIIKTPKYKRMKTKLNFVDENELNKNQISLDELKKSILPPKSNNINKYIKNNERKNEIFIPISRNKVNIQNHKTTKKNKDKSNVDHANKIQDDKENYIINEMDSDAEFEKLINDKSNDEELVVDGHDNDINEFHKKHNRIFKLTKRIGEKEDFIKNSEGEDFSSEENKRIKEKRLVSDSLDDLPLSPMHDFEMENDYDENNDLIGNSKEDLMIGNKIENIINDGNKNQKGKKVSSKNEIGKLPNEDKKEKEFKPTTKTKKEKIERNLTDFSKRGNKAERQVKDNLKLNASLKLNDFYNEKYKMNETFVINSEKINLEKTIKDLLTKVEDLNNKYNSLIKDEEKSEKKKTKSKAANKTELILNMPLLPMPLETELINKTIKEIKENDLDLLNKKREGLINESQNYLLGINNNKKENNEKLKNPDGKKEKKINYDKKEKEDRDKEREKEKDRDRERDRDRESDTRKNPKNFMKYNTFASDFYDLTQQQIPGLNVPPQFTDPNIIENLMYIKNGLSLSPTIQQPNSIIRATNIKKSPFSEKDYLDHHVYFVNGDREKKKHSKIKGFGKMLLKKIDDIKQIEQRLMNLTAKCEQNEALTNNKNIEKKPNRESNSFNEDKNLRSNNIKKSKNNENDEEENFKRKLKDSKEDNLNVYDNEIKKILNSILDKDDIKTDNRDTSNKNKSRLDNNEDEGSVFPLLFIEKSIKKLDNDFSNLKKKVHPDLMLNLS